MAQIIKILENFHIFEGKLQVLVAIKARVFPP